MAEYTFWDTNCGVDPVDPESNSTPNPEVTDLELASYIVTDWQPYGYASGAARTVVRQFLDLIMVGEGGRWVMKRQSHLLTRGWKGMISEAVGIAFSRHSAAVTKNYHFCVHIDHFLNGGIFHSDLFRVERVNDQLLRPDYLLAARRFPARHPGMAGERVCASLEVKGTGRYIRGQVPPEQKIQSENIRLVRVNEGEEISVPLHQKILSLVRANPSLVTENCRSLDVRHANYYCIFPYLEFEDQREEIFLMLVIGHYLRILDHMTDRRFTTNICSMFRYPSTPYMIQGDLLFTEVIRASKKLEEEGLVFLSDSLIKLLDEFFSGRLFFDIRERGNLDPLEKHLKVMEQESMAQTSEDVFYRPDGFMFRRPRDHNG